MHDIHIPNIDDIYFSGRSRRGSNVESIAIEKHYRIELFYTVVDMQLQELSNRFNETNSRLLICMACLTPTNLFSSFSKAKLVKFAKFYPWEFSQTSLMLLDNQLETLSLICATIVNLHLWKESLIFPKSWLKLEGMLFIHWFINFWSWQWFCLLPQQPSNDPFLLWRLWKLDYVIEWGQMDEWLSGDLYWKWCVEGHW